MTDLLLINPGGREVIYQDLGSELTGVEPPLWCRLIAGYCRDRGHSVEILDAEAWNMSPHDVVNYVTHNPPRLVGAVVYGHQPNASTQQMASASELCHALKKSRPDIPIAICGGHVSALPHQTFDEESVDYVINGQGPKSIAMLLESQWKLRSQIITEKGAKLDLDSDLHGNTWDLLPMDRYRAHNWQCFDGSQRIPYASIYTSLNCPYSCSFCCISAPFGGSGYQTRSPIRVVDEVRYLYHTYGVSTYKIIDEMFVLKPSHYLLICKGLAELPFADELNIWCYARVDTVKPDTLALMRKAGIRWLCLGIESGSAHVRDGSLKTIDGQDIMAVVKAIQNAGINVLGNFIFGLPDDTLESMQETLELARAIECEYSNFYSAMAYPGSKLHEQANPEDLPKSWSGYSQHSRDTTPLPTATLSARDVLAFRDEAFRTYFSDPAYIDRIGRKFGDHAVREIEIMTSYQLERELLK